MATYAVGDIQGCYQPLCRLLEQVRFDPAKDTLWASGDLVNRGPRSLEVLRFLRSMAPRARTVLGNHDLHLLARARGRQHAYPSDTLGEVLAAPDCQELLDWLRQQPLLLRAKKENWILVHAGIPPQWDLEEAEARAREVETALRGEDCDVFLAEMYGDMPTMWDDSLDGTERLRLITNYLTRMRICTAEGQLLSSFQGRAEEAPPGYRAWFAHPGRKTRQQRILFGHWAALQGQADAENVYALDTGCVWGHRLRCLRLEDERSFEYNCGETMR